MIYIVHRCNTTGSFTALSKRFGVEIDLRSNVLKAGEIHLSHDPWRLGEYFESWLQGFVEYDMKGPIILNTKEDGLEKRVIELLKKFRLKNWFFLDTAIPTLIHWTQLKKETRFAARISCYENLDFIEKLKVKPEWVWVDCFNGLPIDEKILSELGKNYKICLVSPELHGHHHEDLTKFQNLFKQADAVCTKSPTQWQSLEASVFPNHHTTP